MNRPILLVLMLYSGICVSSAFAQNESTARKWNKQVLFAISADFARPTVHARNLFHTSIAMYDSWMAYEPGGNTYLLGKSIGSFTSEFSGVTITENIDSVREMAMSYAVYRIIEHRYSQSPGLAFISDSIDSLMDDLGYDPSIESADYTNGGAAELGNYIAAQIIEFGLQDGANESGNYSNLYYEPVNPPLAVEEPGNPTIVDPNRWQQITLSESIDQSGELVANTPDFLSPEWGDVIPFSMTDDDLTVQNRDGFDYNVYFDPGAPPYIEEADSSCLESFYKWNFVLVPIWQAHLDVEDTTVWDISPGSIGNLQAYPEEEEEYQNFYDLTEGGDGSTGYDVNPVSGEPYEPQLVKRADYARVLAEFWADGPNSVTPPGHWFDIYNHVSDHELFERKWMGAGSELADLEYDVRAYFALGGAMHDAAIAAWSIKGYYDYLRPVSAVRYMAEKGQCSDINLPNYDPSGIPLIADYIELVGNDDPLAGPESEHVKKIKIFTWRGPDYIEDPDVDEAGVGWILAENWWPYQRPSFVTPPFAGFVSGHSTYSRTAAELMDLMTGSPFFPGGMSGFEIEQNEFLVFEDGPSQSFQLQWATYQDASDQCSLSRIWGGIHPPIDDIPGRKIGIELGPQAFNHANAIIEETKPYVVDYSVDNSEVNADFIGNNLTVSVIFDQEMNQNIEPQLSFLQSELADALTEVSSGWIDSFEFTYTFLVEDILIEGVPTTFSVKSAQDLSGLEQNPLLVVNAIQLDTKKPELLDVEVSDSVITDQTIAGADFSVTLSFSEPCNENQSINLEWISVNNIGNSLVPNTEIGGWLNSQTFIAVYNLTDENITVQDVALLVSLGEDLLGNQMNEAVEENIIVLDTKNPDVIDISVNDPLLTIQDYGNTNPTITITFDEPMNNEGIPQLVFPNQNPLETSLSYNPIASEWVSENTCEIHYLFEWFEAEFIDVDVSLENFRDANGNPLNQAVVQNLFSIDTKRPIVEGVSPQSAVVSDQNVDGFFIDVEFSEIMDTDQFALVLPNGDEWENSLTLNFNNSSWLNDTIFRASYDVSDQNSEVENIGIAVNFASDESGNLQSAYQQSEGFRLDTKNPILESFSVSDNYIDQSDIGSESLTILMIFDEEMDTNGSVDLLFSPQDLVNSILLQNQNASEWLNPLTFKMVFDVAESIESVPLVTLLASNGKDLAGNPMILGSFDNVITIDMGTLSAAGRMDNPNMLIFPTVIASGDPVSLKVFGNTGRVTLKIIDMTGKVLQENDFGALAPGIHSLPLPAYSRGVYVYRIEQANSYYSGKLIIQ